MLKKQRLILLISKDAINVSKVTVKSFIILQDLYFKQMLFIELSVYQRILKMYYGFHKNIKHQKLFALIRIRCILVDF